MLSCLRRRVEEGERLVAEAASRCGAILATARSRHEHRGLTNGTRRCACIPGLLPSAFGPSQASRDARAPKKAYDLVCRDGGTMAGSTEQLAQTAAFENGGCKRPFAASSSGKEAPVTRVWALPRFLFCFLLAVAAKGSAPLAPVFTTQPHTHHSKPHLRRSACACFPSHSHAHLPSVSRPRVFVPRVSAIARAFLHAHACCGSSQ